MVFWRGLWYGWGSLFFGAWLAMNEVGGLIAIGGDYGEGQMGGYDFQCDVGVVV